MHYGLVVCTRFGSLKGADFVKIQKEVVSFIPTMYEFNDYDGEWKGDKILKRFQNASEKDYLVISNGFESLSISEIEGNNPYQMIEVIQQSEITEVMANFVMNLCGGRLLCAYLHNDDYTAQQGAHDEMAYKIRNIPLSKAANLSFVFNHFKQKKFDISKNYGQMYMLDKFAIMAAWKMWFTEKVFNDIDKNLLLGISFAEKVISEENGRIFIQLFDSVEDSEMPHNRERQRKFLENINSQMLIKKYSRYW